MVFTAAQKVTKHLGYFCNFICCTEIPNIAQSGHTAIPLSFSLLFLVGYLIGISDYVTSVIRYLN